MGTGREGGESLVGGERDEGMGGDDGVAAEVCGESVGMAELGATAPAEKEEGRCGVAL